jgi:alcohol dehydrogenase class IV
MRPRSPISGIRAGVLDVPVFKQSGADIIVSVGGGSPIDASKAIIYFIHERLGGDFLGQVGLGYTDEVGQKTTVRSQYLTPSDVILDAELTLATPERLW